MEYPIPDSIKDIIGKRDYVKDTIGMSDSEVICFDDMVLKIEKEGEESDNEHRILQWLQGKIPVPEIIVSEKKNGFSYLLMTRIYGVMACDEFYLQHPKELIHLLVEGLKIIWTVDISNCPYNNDLDNKLRLAEYRVKNNLCTDDVEPDTYGENGFKDSKELFNWLASNKPEERLVFSHGDYCLPNVFIKNGGISGFIDLGRAGTADKWQDIALCVRSIEHNFGMNKGYIKQFFEELNIEPNWEKVRYYILLDELF